MLGVSTARREKLQRKFQCHSMTVSVNTDISSECASAIPLPNLPTPEAGNTRSHSARWMALLLCPATGLDVNGPRWPVPVITRPTSPLASSITRESLERADRSSGPSTEPGDIMCVLSSLPALESPSRLSCLFLFSV